MNRIYFTDGGAVGLDLTAAPGRYAAHWIDIASGEWGRRETIAGGAVTTITAPAKGHCVVAVVNEEPNASAGTPPRSPK